MPVCPDKMHLMHQVQQTLEALTRLMQREHKAVETESEETMLAIDREIERLFGEKERSMGAFQQHCKQHGC